jgi:hypothetical protein
MTPNLRAGGIVVVAMFAAACTSGDGAGGSSVSTSSSGPRTNTATATATPIVRDLAPTSARGTIVASAGDVFELDLRTGDLTRLTALPGDQFDADAFGPLVVYRDSSRGVNVDDEIALVDARTRRVTNLTNAPDSDEWGPAWSPDGTRIAFSSDREGLPQIYVMDADGSHLERLSDVEGEYPSWSPDGSTIAFASQVGGTTPFGDPDYDILVMDADGGNVRNLTNDPDAYDMYPSFSPDGTAIAFESTAGTPPDYEPPSYDLERLSDMDVWVMDADGSNARDVTNDLEHLDSFPDWGPGPLIVYDREGAIVLLDPETGARLDVTERTGVSGGFPAWID